MAYATIGASPIGNEPGTDDDGSEGLEVLVMRNLAPDAGMEPISQVEIGIGPALLRGDLAVVARGDAAQNRSEKEGRAVR